MSKDKSPEIPDMGPVYLSNLFKRRASSTKNLVSDSYVKFEDYDNLSLLSIDSVASTEYWHEVQSIPQSVNVTQKKG